MASGLFVGEAGSEISSALRNKRRVFGCEINENYYKLAKERINFFKKQLKMAKKYSIFLKMQKFLNLEVPFHHTLKIFYKKFSKF